MLCPVHLAQQASASVPATCRACCAQRTLCPAHAVPGTGRHQAAQNLHPSDRLRSAHAGTSSTQLSCAWIPRSVRCALCRAHARAHPACSCSIGMHPGFWVLTPCLARTGNACTSHAALAADARTPCRSQAAQRCERPASYWRWAHLDGAAGALPLGSVQPVGALHAQRGPQLRLQRQTGIGRGVPQHAQRSRQPAALRRARCAMLCDGAAARSARPAHLAGQATGPARRAGWAGHTRPPAELLALPPLSPEPPSCKGLTLLQSCRPGSRDVTRALPDLQRTPAHQSGGAAALAGRGLQAASGAAGSCKGSSAAALQPRALLGHAAGSACAHSWQRPCVRAWRIRALRCPALPPQRPLHADPALHAQAPRTGWKPSFPSSDNSRYHVSRGSAPVPKPHSRWSNPVSGSSTPNPKSKTLSPCMGPAP